MLGTPEGSLMHPLTLSLAGVVMMSLSFAAAQTPDKAKKLSPEEMKKAVSDALEKFDRNKDGFLSADELPPPLAKLMEKLDRSGDGKLDAKEIIFLVVTMRGGPMAPG